MKKAFALLIVCLSNIALFANHWTPEGSSYPDVMAMYAVIQINGVEQYSDQLEVGVFCGEECRGSALAREFPLTHRYLAIVNIYGVSGHQLTFKLYDHSTGQVFEPVSQEAITFSEDGCGNPIEPYMLNFIGEPSEVAQTVLLSEGWNWFSTYLDITLDDLKAALEEALPGVTSTNPIKITSQNSKTLTYNGSSWRGSGFVWNAMQMYKIQAPSSGELTLQGSHIVYATIDIFPGFNWIGYPLNEAMTVADVFANFDAVQNDKVSAQNSNASTFNGSRWRGQLTNLNPGMGYKFYSVSSETRTLTFPTSARKTLAPQ